MTHEKCSHEVARFLPCSTADRFPGRWICDACGESFNFDPLGRTSVRYLDKPNPRATKSVNISQGTGKG